MMNSHYNHFYPQREADASHPDVMLDRNRCIYCELCVRASRVVDGKNVFGLTGRGIKTVLAVNSASGLLGDTTLAVTDKAAHVCPTGAILIKRKGFAVPIGQRIFDHVTIKDLQTGGRHE
jgi:[NiFe] hydrogenase diaphorase moiety small subunit